MGTPVSGPGPYAQRTDKQPVREMPAAEYGERQETTDLQASAPMAQSGGVPADFASMFGDPSSRVVGFGEDSGRPDEPVTEGAALGVGAGTEALSSSQKAANNYIKSYLVALEWMANRGTSDSARNLIRNLKGRA